jgi:hypothetical protein
MMKFIKIRRRAAHLAILFICPFYLLAQIQSPEEFLVTNYGEHFTPHHLLVEYARYLADNSDYMTIETYGYTNEKRPLLLATFTTPANHSQIEDIRKSNMNITGIERHSDNNVNEKAILWMSFGVHGNEAAGPESSMTVMYKLANPDAQTRRWLDNTVVLIDPSINPDGYSRYTHWVWQVAGKEPHPTTSDREHMEPWPGGRTNHYHFDLNRDWAWQTQVESQQRFIKYNQWMPHIHADFHEMGYNSHYYFAPAAKPYHEYMTQWQRDFQIDIGKNHAKYFDKEGWIYFTRERFDLLYPSYGDTYPTFNGAIGMTYEKGGSGRAGRAIIMDNGDTLRLRDRIDHHVTTALSTVEITSLNADRLVANFKKYYQDNINNPKGKFKTYVIKSSESSKALAELLKRNKIDFAYATESQKLNGYHYQSEEIRNFEVEPEDIVIDVKQPKSTLLQVLFEPDPMLEDSITYDITAWCIPFAYGVETYGLTAVPTVNTAEQYSEMMDMGAPNNPYAYHFEWGSNDAHRVIAAFAKNGIRMRVADRTSSIQGDKVDRATVVIMKGDNKHVVDWNEKVISTLNGTTVNWGYFESGFSDAGGDLGGRRFRLLENPKVMILAGEGVGSNTFGQVWHYFENHLHYPVSVVNKDEIGRVDLDDYDVLVMPDGYYRMSKGEMDDLSSWIRGGGKLIAIGGALRNLSDQEGFALARYATEDEKKAADKAAEEKAMQERLVDYEGQERRRISQIVPGAIVQNKVDATHPLGYGLGGDYYSLKTSSATYNWLKDAWNVVYVPETFDSYGFIGKELKDKLGGTVSFAVEEKGRGSVVYMVDNPLYRGFWHNGLHLFTNAVFMVE